MEEGRRRRGLFSFYGMILAVFASIWVVWGVSYLWFELRSDEEPNPLSLVESAEDALARGDEEEARKRAELARLLIDSRLEGAEGTERVELLRLKERISAVDARLTEGAKSPK